MNPLVTPIWLVSRLKDPNVVILDATLPQVGVGSPNDTRARYLAGHIPGAVFFDIDELSDQATSLPHMLPSAEIFSHMVSALGIADSMTIVVYEQGSVFSAPRAWWMLRSFGARNVYVLDGGFQAWVKAGFPTHSGPVPRIPASFEAHLDREAVANLAQIRQMVARREQIDMQILDARSTSRFSGTSPEPRPGIPSGHMPGATNVPYTDLIKEGRFMQAEKLRELFTEKGVDLQQPITTTCGSGITAAVISLALEIAGAKHVSLYDGSWTEYAQHSESVIEKTSSNDKTM